MKVQEVLDLLKNTGGKKPIPTGFNILDAHMDGGLFKKEIGVIGGDTGQGKSFIAIQMMYEASKRGFKSAYFSLEISNETVVARMLAQLSGEKYSLIQKGEIANVKAYEKAEQQLIELSESMDFYDDLYEMKDIEDTMELEAYEIVFVDFIQNVVQKGDEYERMSYIARRFQRLAKKRNCCIWLLSQISNEMANRSGAEKKPRFKGSGNIGIASDFAFFIERNDLDKSIMDFFLSKNRRGEGDKLFQFRLSFPSMKFYDY